MKNNPVKKNMDKFHKPRTHRDKTKYNRRSESEKLMDDLEPILDDLKEAINISNHQKIRDLFIKLVPAFKPQSSIVDLLYKK